MTSVNEVFEQTLYYDYEAEYEELSKLNDSKKLNEFILATLRNADDNLREWVGGRMNDYFRKKHHSSDLVQNIMNYLDYDSLRDFIMEGLEITEEQIENIKNPPKPKKSYANIDELFVAKFCEEIQEYPVRTEDFLVLYRKIQSEQDFRKWCDEYFEDILLPDELKFALLNGLNYTNMITLIKKQLNLSPKDLTLLEKAMERWDK